MDEFIQKLKNSILKKEHTILNGEFKDIHEIRDFDVVFVDGGECMLYETATIGIGLVRICGLSYKNNKRINRDIKEFYVLLESDKDVSVKCQPSILNDMKLPRTDIKDALSMVRRIAELDYCNSLNGMIILDGTLQYVSDIEKHYVSQLLHKQVCGLSKTTTYGMDAIPITRILHDKGSKNPWYHSEGYVKLHKRSDYIFKIEFGNIDKNEIVSILASNSKDPVFLGYPYGLIDVDQNARISEEEKKMLQIRLMIKLGKQWTDLSINSKSINAHEILDSIRY